MRKNILVFAFFAFITQIHFAQQQLENPGFETWDGSGATLEPVDWSSLKTSNSSTLAQLAPQVLFQDNGREGGFSAKLENKSALGIVANGILTNGRVHADTNPNNGYVYTDANDGKWNTPFTSRPDSIVGWYKFQPATSGANTDKGKVEVFLHKTANGQNPVGSTADNMVGKARFDMATAASEWTRFSAGFNYASTDNPEYILVVLTSGDSTNAISGSIAWFDDLELIYNNSSSVSNSKIQNIHVAQLGSSILIKGIQEGNQYTVLNALGQTIKEGVSKSNETKISMQDTGVYFVRIATSSGVVTRKIAFVKD